MEALFVDKLGFLRARCIHLSAHMAEAAIAQTLDAVVAAKRAKRPITDPVEKRVSLIAANYDLPEDVRLAQAEIIAACLAAGKTIEAVQKRFGTQRSDIGRVLHSLDLIRQASICAQDSLSLAQAHHAEA